MKTIFTLNGFQVCLDQGIDFGHTRRGCSVYINSYPEGFTHPGSFVQTRIF